MHYGYGYLGNTNLSLVDDVPEMISCSFQWDLDNNCPPINETDLHTYILGTTLTRSKINELLLINNTLQMIGSPEIYVKSIWSMGNDVQAYTLDQFQVKQTNVNVGDLTGTMTFDSSTLMLGPNLWFFPFAMIQMNAAWDFRHEITAAMTRNDAQFDTNKRRLDDLYTENAILQEKIRKIDEEKPPEKPPSNVIPTVTFPNNMTLQLPTGFMSELQTAIRDGMSDATVSVSGGGESIWSKLFGVTVQSISTVGGHLGAAALSAAIMTEGNAVNSAVEGVVQGTVQSIVNSAINAAISAVTERIVKETNDGVNKLLDNLFGKQREEDRTRDIHINNNMLVIEEIKKTNKRLIR
ncbi:hypothetical protein DPMN_111082 [Dreissena polymorpha]|uniref:Uncharacterized protein n=1 Tax=Dreissena polymorpha TaxID=45954 RepID=A0A9D4KDL0_DREPO|nr:hypothetical protein DPMN_111082 [Dreissena polymorpha]